MKFISYKECLGIEEVDRKCYAMKDTYPFLAFGGKINPLSEIQNAGIVTTGSVFFVKAVADADYSTVQAAVGPANMFNDIQTAINKCRNYANDYVLVCPQASNGTWSNTTNVGSAIIVNKSGMHLLAVGYGNPTYNQNVSIGGLGTGVGVDTSVVKVVAADVEIAGFNIVGTSGTTANGTINTGIVWLGTAASGTAHQTWIHDCIIENAQASGGGANGTADCVQTAGTVNGVRFDNVAFVSRTTGAKGVNFGNGNGRPEFHACRFVTTAQATSDLFVSTGTGANDFTLFDRCQFFNLSSSKPASAITGSITANTHWVGLDRCSAFNVTAFGTDPGVLVTEVQSGTAAAGMHSLGIGIQGTAAVPAA